MKAVFLDRDGVINKYPGDTKYVMSWKEFRFLPKAKKAIAKLRENGFKVFVISNQAGVGKGLFSSDKLGLITRNMLREVKEAGGRIERVYYCTHRKDENCPCRKPKAGLIDIIKKKYPVKLKDTFFIGDTIRDVRTAAAAGCKSILVLCGREKMANRRSWEARPDFVFKNLYSAAEFILRGQSSD